MKISNNNKYNSESFSVDPISNVRTVKEYNKQIHEDLHKELNLSSYSEFNKGRYIDVYV